MFFRKKFMAYIDLNMSNEEYHEHHALSKSKLMVFAKSPAHYYDKYEAADRDSLEDDIAGSEGKLEDQNKFLGKAIHVAVLEPELFEEKFLVVPKMDKRTTAGKTDFATFSKICADTGQVMISEADADICVRIRRAVLDHPLLGEFVKKSPLKEAAFFWTDTETGLDMKAKIDLISLDNGIILDAKSARSTEVHKFEGAINEFYYHFQPPIYNMGVEALLGRAMDGFIYAAIEKKRPCGIKLYSLDDISISAGYNHVRELMLKFAECKATGVWPGYSPEIKQIGLPRYALARYGMLPSQNLN